VSVVSHEMSKGRSSVSKARSYLEIGQFWDTHDLADYWEQTHPVEFEVDIRSEVTYYPLDGLFPPAFVLWLSDGGFLRRRF